MSWPTIFDDGEAGTWLDAIYHSPCLKVSDYASGDSAERLCTESGCGQPAGTVCTYALCPGKRRSASPFHSPTPSLGGQDDHV